MSEVSNFNSKYGRKTVVILFILLKKSELSHLVNNGYDIQALISCLCSWHPELLTVCQACWALFKLLSMHLSF